MQTSKSKLIVELDGKVEEFTDNCLYFSDLDDLMSKFGFQTLSDLECRKILVYAPNGKKIKSNKDPYKIGLSDYVGIIQDLSRKLGYNLTAEVQWGS